MGEYLCREADCGYGSQPNSTGITSVRGLNQKVVMGGKRQSIFGLLSSWARTCGLVIAGVGSRSGRVDRYL